MSLRAPIVVDHGSGPVLLLLHAFPLDHRLWSATVDPLADACRVVVPDLPGFGRAAWAGATAAGATAAGDSAVAPAGNPEVGPAASPAASPAVGPAVGPAVWTMDALADAVARTLDLAGLRPAVVAGCSMGGYVALALAERRPDLVPRLVLVDSRARADSTAEAEGRAALVAALEGAGAAAADLLADRMLPRLLAPEAPADLVESVRAMILDQSPAAAAAALRGMAVRPDRTAVLARLPGLLAVGGALDPITPRDEIRAVAALSPGGRAEVVDGAGHLPQIEQPERFVEILRSALPA